MLTRWHRWRTEIRVHTRGPRSVSVIGDPSNVERRADSLIASYFCLSCCLSRLNGRLFTGRSGIEKAPG